jgi:hypothetical protein
MSRLLKRLQIRLGRSKPIVGCPWKNRRRMKRLREIRTLIATLSEGEVILYADEVDALHRRKKSSNTTPSKTADGQHRCKVAFHFTQAT